MDLDPRDVIDRAAEAASEASTARLNATVAVTVAILATFLGICKVKDDNIVQGMQQAQVDKLDYWAYYQARNIRADVADAAATQLELARGGAAPGQLPAYDRAIADYRAKAADQLKKRDELRAKAEEAERLYKLLNDRDDQFDVSDALLAIAIAMLAVTALTRLWPLFFVSLVPTFFGLAMGIAGLAALPIYPAMLIRWLA
jgi:hypothetical protein